MEAFFRMLREDVPTIIGTKVDDSRIVGTDGTLTGGGALTADLSLGIDIGAETERIQDVMGLALTDTATIDFTYSDVAGTITADLKNTTRRGALPRRQRRHPRQLYEHEPYRGCRWADYSSSERDSR
jgi:hypothetical protein